MTDTCAPEVRVRAARRDDAATLAELNQALAAETEDEVLDPDTVRRGVRRFLEGAGAGFYVVAEIDGRVVGCLMVTHEWSDWNDGDMWWLQSVYVRPEARRRGVFRALFAEVRRRAAANADVHAIRLYVERDNGRAQQTYAALGLVEKPYRILELRLRADG